MQLQLSDLDLVAYCDPSGKKKGQEIKRVRARSAVVVVGADLLDRVFVLHCWLSRGSTDEMTDHIFLVNETFKPPLFGIEANAMQSLYGDSIGREARYKGKRLPVTPIYQDTKVDKDFRIRAGMQPVIAQGRLFLQPGMDELKAEITSFPLGRTKDGIDALNSAIQMLPRRAIKREEHEEVDALAQYLRESGAPAGYIEQRIAEEREKVRNDGPFGVRIADVLGISVRD